MFLQTNHSEKLLIHKANCFLCYLTWNKSPNYHVHYLQFPMYLTFTNEYLWWNFSTLCMKSWQELLPLTLVIGVSEFYEQTWNQLLPVARTVGQHECTTACVCHEWVCIYCAYMLIYYIQTYEMYACITIQIYKKNQAGNTINNVTSKP